MRLAMAPRQGLSSIARFVYPLRRPFHEDRIPYAEMIKIYRQTILQ